MNVIPFAWGHQKSLATELAIPFVRASTRVMPHGRPISLTLWRPNRIGMKIQCDMRDLEKRVEVGVLAFDTVDSLHQNERIFESCFEFQAPLKVAKLVIYEEDFCVESGVMIQDANERQLIIVAGVFPYTLAISGLMEKSHFFEPEYALSRYIVSSL